MNTPTTRILTIAALLSLATATGARAADTVALDRASVVVGADEPTYVQYGAQELAGYLKELTGSDVAILASPAGASGVRIIIGAQAARQIAPHGLPDATAGEEAYRLRYLAKDGVEYVLAAGTTPPGTKAALTALMRVIRVTDRSAHVPAGLDMTGKPAVAMRGMHFNGWAFNSPYSFRAWSEAEWCRYLDLLACQGVNLFYLWPFIEIMPVPLSPEDQAYLEECRRVIDYAQKQHGMEVWIMQCTNRVAKDRCGVDDPRLRPYWRPSQEDLDPGKPEHFQAIMASRAAMYAILNNADGVCNIDSDPGYCPGSPLSDYYKVLQGCRELLDKHNLHGRQTKLINWMWHGWGRGGGQKGTIEHHQLLTVQGLKPNLPEPWWLIAGWGDLLTVCREEDALGKTVFLPYGAIEDEPSYPATNLNIDALREQFDRFVAGRPELGGVMGNVQTPLLQFPDVYYFTSAMFDAEYRQRPEGDVLLDLAGYLYPDQRQLIADCYLGLREPDPRKVQALHDRLGPRVRQDKLGRPGLFGRKLFPDRRIVAQALLLQLQLRAAGLRLEHETTPSLSQADIQQHIHDYLDAYLAWDTAHGWHQLWGWDSWQLATPPAAAESLAEALGDNAAVEACFAEVSRKLSARHDKLAVETGCIAPLKAAVLGNVPIKSLAQEAKASASVAPKPEQYPPSAAIDGKLGTLYWPGALVENNSEWLQLTWDSSRTFNQVVVRFLPHPSMPGRTIRLQKETSPDNWEDFATTVIPADAPAAHAVATFALPSPVTLNKIRIVNLLDVFEVEIR